MNYRTEQESFWAGKVGEDYINRNKSQEYLSSNINFFSQVFRKIEKPSSVVEFGANVEMNLRAIKLLFPEMKCLELK